MENHLNHFKKKSMIWGYPISGNLRFLRILQAGHVEAEHGAGRDQGLGDGLEKQRLGERLKS
jgi:hypothetical protein